MPSRVSQIVARFAAAIESGALVPGERLASIRAAAADQGVSKNTMAEAYERLVASGHLEARQGSGHVVAQRRRPPPAPAPHLAEALDLVSLLREQTEAHYALRPGEGRPPASWMEESELGRHFHRAPRGAEHGYGSSWGYAPLRERVALTLQSRGIAAGPEQVLLTQGANHALDLILRQRVEPGDAVLVDDPGYYPLFGKLRLAKARIIGIPRRPEGPDLAVLAARLAEHRPKLFITQSLAHNPTGAGLTPAHARALLQLTAPYDLTIVEDDAFADLLPAAAPRLAALDGLRRVIQVGTFSKTLSASLRVGWLAGAPETVRALNDLKLVTIVATSQYAERLVHGLIAEGHYRRHLRRLRARVEKATEQALADLRGVGLSVARPPIGGFYLWAGLPPGVDEVALCRAASAESIFLAPGRVFRVERGAEEPALRLHVAHASEPAFLRFLARALPRLDGSRDAS